MPRDQSSESREEGYRLLPTLWEKSLPLGLFDPFEFWRVRSNHLCILRGDCRYMLRFLEVSMRPEKLPLCRRLNDLNGELESVKARKQTWEE